MPDIENQTDTGNESKNSLPSGSDHDETLSIESPHPLHDDSEPKPATGFTQGLEEERPPSKPVPRIERRGLFSQLTLVAEQETALGHSNKEKVFIVFIVSAAAIIAPLGASILLPALGDLSSDLHVSTSVVNVSFGLYILSLGIFPLWWSAFSELNGRRTVYVLSFFLYTVFSIACAVCQSIGALMVCRILAGGAAASVQAVGAGSVSDIYVSSQRGRAMGYFYLGPLCGPLLAPIMGGALTTAWGWRGTQWFCSILGAVMTTLIIFGLPETLKRPTAPLALEPTNSHASHVSATEDVADPLAPVPSRTSRRSFVMDPEDPQHPHHHGFNLFHLNNPLHHGKSEIGPWKMARTVFMRPFGTFRFLKFFPVSLAMVYSSYCFCALYFLNIGIESLYSQEPYNFSSIILGLLYVPNSVGYIISSIANGYWSDYVIMRSFKRHGKMVPEARLSESVILASVLFPSALLVFGWTAHAKTFWVFPLIGTFVFGIASMLIFGNVMTYLLDALPGRGSSGVALSNLFRMVLAAIATFVADPLEKAMGYGWLYTMLAIGSVLAFFSIVSIKVWGSRWRESFDVTTLY